MARYTGPKHRLCRREGAPICGSPKCPVLRNPNPPGQPAKKRRKKASEYGLQLREKQKAKRTYGVLERQFRRYVREAQKAKGQTGEKLLQLLETRLDNVVYRLGFAPSRPATRQLVTHGHVLVDGKKVNIPSYGIKPNQTITITSESLNTPTVKKTIETTKSEPLPPWLVRKAAVGKVLSLPKREDIATDINEQLIVEFYSR